MGCMSRWGRRISWNFRRKAGANAPAFFVTQIAQITQMGYFT